MPATRAASEVVFSALGFLMPKSATTKRPEHVGAEVFIQANIELHIPPSDEIRQVIHDAAENEP